MNKKELGDLGENIARAFLEGKGYEILAQNFRFMRREVDIIARGGEYIVFIEVKTRTGTSFGTAAESVNKYKQKHIISAARGWLLENKTGLQPRFDVLEIYVRDGKNYVRHIKHAFILTEKNKQGGGY